MEEALYDTPVMRRFAQLGGLAAIPDETTILNFRGLLETHSLAAKILARVNTHLSRKGPSLRGGTIVDATIIAAPSWTRNQQGKRDPEMHQTRKGNPWYFGMKAYIGVDDASGLVHHVQCTAANEADVTRVHKLLHGKEDTICGDSGYTGADKRQALQGVKSVFLIAEKPSKLRAIKNARERRNAEGWEHFKASLRAKQGGASVPGDQAPVWLHPGALPGPGQERSAGSDVVCVVEPVDGAPVVVAGGKTGASVRREKP